MSKIKNGRFHLGASPQDVFWPPNPDLDGISARRTQSIGSIVGERLSLPISSGEARECGDFHLSKLRDQKDSESEFR